MDRKELLQDLLARVSDEELKSICFNLTVEYDDLEATGRKNKARELVMFLERHNRLSDLEAELTSIGATQGEGLPEILRPYLELMVRRYGRLSLGALDPSGQESTRVSLRQVFINLDADTVFLPLLSSNPQQYQFFRATIAHIFHNRQFILLGDPGSGKSTLLRFLAYCLANHGLEPEADWLQHLCWQSGTLEMDADKIIYGRNVELNRYFEEEDLNEQQWTGNIPVPLFLDMRDFARTDFDAHNPLALWQFCESRLEQDGLQACTPALKRLAEQGRILFLLDGVDEVPSKERAAIWQAIAALENGIYGGNRWVATCRILSYVAEEAPTGIPIQTLRPLTTTQINRFVATWYSALYDAGQMSRDEAEQKIHNLQTAVVKRSRLHPLAQNPMLLTIMALVQTFYGTLPDERAKLYQACVKTLLLRWQRHKESDSTTELPDVLAQLETTQEELERLLWEIAWQAHRKAGDREKAADIPEWELLKIARKHLGSLHKAESFLAYTERRAHLLLGRGGQKERVYTFPHRTIQEYLAACHLASMRRFTREATKLAEESGTWQETLNLAAGTLVYNQNNREKALDGVAGVLPDTQPRPHNRAGWRRVWLAAEMMLVVGREAAEKDEVGQGLLPKLRNMLVPLVAQGQLTPQQRAEAGNTLGLLGDTRSGICTLEPDMIKIEHGSFLMHEGEMQTTIDVDTFAIALYTITNAQFAFFVAGDGYSNRAYWTKAGWAQKEQSEWQEPRYWQNSDWNKPNQPVVGLSWYEAVAYCRWLSKQTGKTYHLPTEAEWERAARHTDGRTWPWGNETKMDVANSDEVGLHHTTAVGSFPKGQAVCGAQDMSGNVWEWCTTRYRDENSRRYPLPYVADDGREETEGNNNIRRILRGGAYGTPHLLCRSANRNYLIPNLRYYYFGFRVVEHLSYSGS